MSELQLHQYAFEGNFEKLKEKIESDKSYLTTKDGSGRIALHWAASGSQKNIVNYLLQQGSPVDDGDDTNWTPLMIAASVGCADIVSVLISRGAAVNAMNQTGQTALHYAASKNREDIARILLANNAHINAADHMGSTPLHRAASKGNIKIIKIFLETHRNQLDLNARDCVRNTPLHLACEEEQIEAAKILIEAGASTDVLNKVPTHQTLFSLDPTENISHAVRFNSFKKTLGVGKMTWEKKSPMEMAPVQIRPALRRIIEAALYP